MKNILFILLFVFIFSSCDSLQKEIDVDLGHKEEINVLGYVQKNEYIKLLLTKTTSFDAPLGLPPIIDDAIIKVKYNDEIITLNNGVFVDENGFVYNYKSENIVDFNYDTPINLEVLLSEGQLLTATTSIPTIVPFDSVVTKTNNEGKSNHLSYFSDNPNQKNYYRRQLYLKNQFENQKLVQGFESDDELYNGQHLPFGAGYEFVPEDTLISYIFHLPKSYHDYLLSTTFPIDANGNPFGQPGPIQSNINGGNGVFAGFSYFVDTTIIQ